ncbi:hypothetical protein B0O99DRAFT_168542 [Bisporella sp. PMI_857]|nr:hypothetical protein B0O99DRAFT_168542 [Bisporella sp. PMI_857]
MSCEKQFLPANNTVIYCSEACRLHDHASAYTRSHSYSAYAPSAHSPPQSPYTRHLGANGSQTSFDDGPDIIPRASPTQIRPRSYFNSDPYPQSYHQPASVPITPAPSNIYTSTRSSTALASLRELATALPRTSGRGDDSPPKSAASSMSRTGSGVWNYMPFTTSKSTVPTPASSYTQSGYAGQNYGAYSSNGYPVKKEEYSAAKSYGHTVASPIGQYGNTGGMGMDRPLPPRTGGGYGHRPKSIDLVTPFSLGH